MALYHFERKIYYILIHSLYFLLNLKFTLPICDLNLNMLCNYYKLQLLEQNHYTFIIFQNF